MVLEIAELLELEAEILKDLPDKITHALSKANREGRLEELLELLTMSDLLQPSTGFTSYKDGRIVVIGASEVKEEVLLSIANSLGLDKKRFEFCLDYEKAQKFEYRKLQYAPSYRAIMFGAVPHSSTGKGVSSSVIAEMESKDGYPRVVRLNSNQELKITKSNFKAGLEKLLSENYISFGAVS